MSDRPTRVATRSASLSQTTWSPRVALMLLVLSLSFGLIGPVWAEPPPAPSFGPTIDAYARYEGQTQCLTTPQPGVAAFRSLLQDSYGANGGGILRGCDVGGVSEHKEGRAYDWMLDAYNARERATADELLGWLLADDEYGNQHAMARRLGIMYIIWNGQRWRAYQAHEGWTTYPGSNPHTDHIHFSFSWDGAQQRTTYWTAGADPAQTTSFPDVSNTSYYADPVGWMVGHGITTGWGETGLFRPHNQVSRAQMAAFLWRLMDEPAGYAPHGFDDVPPNSYYEEPVRWLRATGITQGTGNSGRFEPHRVLTRGEMAEFLWRTAGRPTDHPPHGFPDVSDSRYYDQAVSWLAAHAITTGYGDTGRFEPSRAVTRAQNAAFMYRFASDEEAWRSAPSVPGTVRFDGA